MTDTKQRSDKKMAKYVVGFDKAQRRVAIYLDGSDMDPGFKEAGTFELAIDPETNRVRQGSIADHDTHEGGDHVFITEARRVLRENGVTVFANMTFEDKASNDPTLERARELPTTQEVFDKNLEEALGAKEENPIKGETKATNKKK